MTGEALVGRLLALSAEIRYVALRRRGTLIQHQRSQLAGASGAESDRYEELLVNPALLTLATSRGEIDCGGCEYLLVHYGHFVQLVHPVDGGHVSIALERHANPASLVGAIREELGLAGLWPGPDPDGA